MIVLDTDVLIEIFDKNSVKGEEALKKIIESNESISITVINLHEILYGLNKYAKPIKDVLRLPVLSYRKQDAILASELELKMELKGTLIRRMDAIIAAITINNNAKLYTFDVKHFKPLEEYGLKIFL
ncbi:MAG: type II toxin-antitoxin system VapC family toxin [Nitrososphaerota archaeon]